MNVQVCQAVARSVNLLLVLMDLVCLEGTGSKVSNLTGHGFVDWMPSQLKRAVLQWHSKVFQEELGLLQGYQVKGAQTCSVCRLGCSNCACVKEWKEVSGSLWWFCEPGIQMWQLPANKTTGRLVYSIGSWDVQEPIESKRHQIAADECPSVWKIGNWDYHWKRHQILQWIRERLAAETTEETVRDARFECDRARHGEHRLFSHCCLFFSSIPSKPRCVNPMQSVLC